MPELTLSMIVKNEERYLRDCLESAKTIADEIIVVDTGSTDRTKEIALEFGAKVYDFKWINDFSAARNFALSKSTGRWILYLDADERLSENSVNDVKRIIKTNRKAGYFCVVHSIDTKYSKSNKMRYARLFKNSNRIKFSGSIHEQIINSLRTEGYALKNTDIEIIHIGYNISQEGLKEKANRNLEYLLNEYAKGKDPYTIFQLAQTYGVLSDREKASKYFAEVINLKCPDFYKAHAYRYIASCELDKNNFQYALELSEQGLEYDTTQPLLNYVTAKIHNKLGHYDKAISYLYKAVECNTNDGKKDFEIYVDAKILISLGLQVSVLSGNTDAFNKFYSLLLQEDGNAQGDPSLSLMRELIGGREFNSAEIGRYAAAVDESNADTVLVLLQNYPHAPIAIQLLGLFSEKIKTHRQYSTEFLNTLGLALMNNGQTDQAIATFELSNNNGNRNPSVIFFLISAYVSSGEFNKITPLLERGESLYSSNAGVMDRINLLKQQLSAVI